MYLFVTRSGVHFKSQTEESWCAYQKVTSCSPRLHLPILHTILHTPADHLHSVATRHATGFVLVDASTIVLKVAVDGECNLNRAAFRDGLLEAGLSTWRDGLAGECVLVTLEVIVGCLGIGTASLETSW